MWKFTCASILLTLLLSSITPTNFTVFTTSNCTELAAHTPCKCLKYRDDMAYRIECQIGEKVLTLTTQRFDEEGEKLHIMLNCNHIDGGEYSVLSAIDIKNSYHLDIRRCEVCAVLSTPQLFDSLGAPSSIFAFDSSLGVNCTRKDLSVLSGLKTLIFNSIDLSLMPVDLLGDLKELIALHFINNKLVLSRNIFDGLENLEALELHRNNLQQLPADVFRNLRKLKDLNLSHNQLRNLSQSLNFETQNNVFAALENLETLELQQNNLQQLPAGVFRNQRKLKRLDLSYNQLHKISMGIFDLNFQLETLDMQHNNLQQLPAGIFQNQLKELNLSYNRLRNISKSVFEGATSLLTLDLSLNFVTQSHSLQLPWDVFVGLKNLETLVMHGNNLQQLPVGIFRNQLKLKKLDLSSNQLRNLSKAVFEGATSLSILHLSMNGIESFQTDVFLLLTNLSEIYLSHNHVRILPSQLFAGNKNLTIVNFSNNSALLTTLPPAFLANLTFLQQFHITSNTSGISSPIDDTYANSSKFKGMTLDNNEFVSLPATFLRGQNKLTMLNLSRNKLRSLPDELFSDTGELRILELSYNQLTEVSAIVFFSLANLKWLYIDNNRLSTIDPNAFIRTTNMLFLKLENNKLNFNDVNKSPFHNLRKLQSLKLRNNSVQFIHRDWHYLITLKELDLSYNNIKMLDFTDLVFMSSVRVLINVSHNQISLINFTSIETYGQKGDAKLYENIDLNNNPIVCDCKLLPFLKYFLVGYEHLPHVKLNIIIDDLYCAKPVDMAFSLLLNVQPNQLLCPIESTLCAPGCRCLERPYDSVLIVNCSNTNLTTKVPTLPSVQKLALQSIELHIEHNNMCKLPTATLPGYGAVTKIYASGNQLSEINVDNLPENLTYLDISGNSFERLNTITLNHFKQSHLKLALAGNPWNCDCDNMQLLQFVQTNSAMITDDDRVYCAVSKNQMMLQYLINNDVCQDDQSMIIALTASITTICLFIALIAVLYYKYQIEIKVWAYKYRICICLVNEEALDRNKKYDAFVSYSHKDEEFIALNLVPELEDGPIPFKLCIHVRDFIVGQYIPEQIIQAIEDSKRTIVVLSQNFIESVWARVEFHTAHQAALNEGRTRVIVIVYGDIGDIDSLDTDLKAYLKMNTYLKWGDPWFWDKLRYAMPHIKWRPPKSSLSCDDVEMTDTCIRLHRTS